MYVRYTTKYREPPQTTDPEDNATTAPSADGHHNTD